ESRLYPAGILADDLRRQRGRGIVLAMHAQQHFVIGVLLHEKAAQVFFQSLIVAAKRFQDADGRRTPGRRKFGAKKTPGSHENEHTVDQRTSEQYGQSRTKDHHNAVEFSVDWNHPQSCREGYWSKQIYRRSQPPGAGSPGQPGNATAGVACRRSPSNSAL